MRNKRKGILAEVCRKDNPPMLYRIQKAYEAGLMSAKEAHIEKLLVLSKVGKK